MADQSFRSARRSPPTHLRSTRSAPRGSRATLIHPGYASPSARSAGGRRRRAHLHRPSPHAIETMGDKSAARRVADAAASDRPRYTRAGRRAARSRRRSGSASLMGAPSAVAADARRAERREPRGGAAAAAAREAKSYFGRPEVFERYVERAHHVEARWSSTSTGPPGSWRARLQRAAPAPEAEETPSPVVDEGAHPDRRGRRRLARASGHVNAGTVEFIVDDGLLLRDEHLAPGRAHRDRDGDRLRPRCAADRRRARRAAGHRPDPRGHAIQCRINAEDPAATSPGSGLHLAVPGTAGPSTRRFRRPPAETSRRHDACPRRSSCRARTANRRGAGCWGASEYWFAGADDDPLHRWALESPEFRAGGHTTTAGTGAAEVDLPRRSSSTRPPAKPRPADILVEVDGRRVPVRIHERRDVRRIARHARSPPRRARTRHHGADAGRSRCAGGEGQRSRPGTCSVSSRP
jgi:acetyl-CoA/propionyl-CoA carboxylase biotin carboxyl carrier protein